MLRGHLHPDRHSFVNLAAGERLDVILNHFPTISGKRGRAIVEGGSGTASRTTGLLGAILSYAVGEGYRPDNPARGVVRPADNRRRIHLTADQYAALGRVLDAASGRGEPWQAVEAMRLLALTGCRAGEISKLKRSECDLRGSCLRLGDTKMGQITAP